MLFSLCMTGKSLKSISKRLNLIHDEIGNKKVIHLYRYRASDLAKHEFIFQYIDKEVDPYLVTERYEGDMVLEDYHDHDTILILCRWLLQLNFTLMIYKLGEYPKEKIN